MIFLSESEKCVAGKVGKRDFNLIRIVDTNSLNLLRQFFWSLNKGVVFSLTRATSKKDFDIIIINVVSGAYLVQGVRFFVKVLGHYRDHFVQAEAEAFLDLD